MARPQFTLRTLLVAMLVVGAFFGGIKFERQRHQGAEEAAVKAVRRMQRGTRNRILNKGGFEFVVNTEEERAALEFTSFPDGYSHQKQRNIAWKPKNSDSPAVMAGPN